MTPPDSGKHKDSCPWSPVHTECTCATPDFGVEWDEVPADDASMRVSRLREGNLDSGEREVRRDPDTILSIRRGLAQRILAALEDSLNGAPQKYEEVAAVRDNLRAIVERKT